VETVKAPPAAIPAKRILIAPVTGNLLSRELPSIDMTGRDMTGRRLADGELIARELIMNEE
jgi:hypothetical protein